METGKLVWVRDMEKEHLREKSILTEVMEWKISLSLFWI